MSRSALTRAQSGTTAIWPLSLRDSLPEIPIPLRAPDGDSLLELGPALAAIYDVVSYSSRSRQRTPIGGLVGQVTLAGDLAPLRELLVWGSLIHVGKNAVKGDGWYTISA